MDKQVKFFKDAAEVDTNKLSDIGDPIDSMIDEHLEMTAKKLTAKDAAPKLEKYSDTNVPDNGDHRDPIESMIDDHVDWTTKQLPDHHEVPAAASTDKTPTPKVTHAYIDRIEEVEDGEDKAVLYIGDDTETMIKIVLPISLLPDDAAEGDNVAISISIDADED